MCILCGGQCGGVGEFLISLGLPFIALYLSRIRGSLVKIKNKFFPPGPDLTKDQDKVLNFRCCGEWRLTGPQKIGPVGFPSRLHNPVPIPLTLTMFTNQPKLAKYPGLQGVKGWLLLLCINLTILIPTSCLYEANCTLDLFYSIRNKILLYMFKTLLVYNILVVISMVSLAIFSFYAGLKLWQLKQNAIRTAKAFLITQLILIVIFMVTRPLIDFPLGGNGLIFGELIKRLIPVLLNFALWYLYLSTSKRVHNTFSEAAWLKARFKQYSLSLEAKAKA